MDLKTAQEILKTAYLKGAFQAFLATARQKGATVSMLAEQIGVSERTMYRYLARIKQTGRKAPRGPYAEVVGRPAAVAGPCEHDGTFFIGRRRICIECMVANFQRELDAQRDPSTDPKPDKVPCVTKKLKGGTGNSKAGAA